MNQANHRRMHTISNKLSEPGRLKYTLKRIRLRFAQYKGKPVIQLLFAYDNELISHTKKIKTARWSNSMKSWYIPYSSKDELRLLHEHFKSKAYIDTKLIETSLKKMEQSLSTKAESLSKLSEKIKQEINLFSDWMRNKRYSESTIKTYTGGLQLFFRFLGNKSPEEVGNGDLERFHKEYIIANQYSVSFQSQVINAVKLFFSKRHRRKLDPELIDRPKKPKLLPNVLSKEEVKQVLEAHGNQKHRAMLSLIYACGLRRGELLNLKLQDVDSKRGLLIIRQSKGKKDRVVPVSERLLGLLREYYKRERPVTYLFEGQNAGTSYSEKSLESVLKQALAKAKITKPVTLHWLRHSYATHLLESGTDLRYIQKLLGHNSSRTTEIYTHVGTKSLQKIKSPFDDL